LLVRQSSGGQEGSDRLDCSSALHDGSVAIHYSWIARRIS